MNRAILALLAIAAVFSTAFYVAPPSFAGEDPVTLPAVAAVGVQLDTFLIGGYAGGPFADAVGTLSSELSPEERQLIGEHLERIFAGVLPPTGLGASGRLRMAYERALSPSGQTRSIRVLGAEVGSGGRLYTAFYFDHAATPGYYDPSGRPMQSQPGNGPLPRLQVTSGFGSRRMHPILNRLLPHTGVDLAASMGEPVRATADGIVAAAGRNGGYGLLVELKHPDGLGTRYAHLSRIEAGITPPRIVHQGQIIGYVGMTGLATGPHLHFEIRRRGQPVDPMVWLASEQLGGSVTAATDWARERRVIAALLARTPTVISSRQSPAL